MQNLIEKHFVWANTFLITGVSVAVSMTVTGGIVWWWDPKGLILALILSGICPLFLAGFFSHYCLRVGERAKRQQQKVNRLNQELEQTLREVRELSGLLPICSYCKKIRDDQGYWRQVEDYVQRHTRARFTHGLCPECYERERHQIKKMLDRQGEDGGGKPD